MVEYILGNYLVGSGKISSEQLEVVVEQLDKKYKTGTGE